MTGPDLRAWRDRMGWTQARAADALGIQPPYYRALESGRQAIRRVYDLACAELERRRAEHAA